MAPGREVCEEYGLFAVGSDYWYLLQPAWLAYLTFLGCAFAALQFALRKWGAKHVLSFLAIANIAGGPTLRGGDVTCDL